MDASAALGRALLIANAAANLPVLREMKDMPSVRRLRDRLHRARFLSPAGFASHYGVFDSFEHARAWLPPSPEFDQHALAAEYVNERMHRIFEYDLPVLDILRRAFDQGVRSVFDIGGSVGVHYHAYRDHLFYPDGLRWTVFEVPSICEVGRRIALAHDATGLRFTDRLEPWTIDADLWLSCGALHYIEDAHPASLLAACTSPPRHLVFNKLPLYEGADFISAQNIGAGAFSPHYVYNRERFITDVQRCGYRLVQQWTVPERAFYLPAHPERCFDSYTGLYFDRTAH